MNKHIKILFTDLDGTLLNSAKKISPGNRAALHDMQAAGHKIVITTGRVFPSAAIKARALGLTVQGCYMICCNGSQIYDWSAGTMLHQTSIPMDLARYIIDQAKAMDIDIQAYSESHVIGQWANDNIALYADQLEVPYQIVADIASCLSAESPKMLAVDYKDPDKLAAFRRHITPLVADRADVFPSSPSLLEIVPKGVNKGAALIYLCQHLQIPLRNSVAAGDQENDLPMIKAAHLGAAMCNAIPALKEAADYVTEHDMDHDGVAEIIYKFIL